MRKLSSISMAAAGLVLAVSTSPVAAQTIGSGTPDIAVGPFGLDALTPGTFGAIAQSFVAPAGAPVLQGFSFFLGDYIGGVDLRFQASVFQFAVDRVLNSALFTSDVRTGSSNIDGYDPFTFTGVNLTLAPGTTYALVLRAAKASADGATNFVGSTTTNTFALGQLFTSTGSTDSDLHAAGAFTPSTASTYGLDAAVRVTFAAPVTATPEPGSLVLLGTGLVGLGGLARRRRRQADH